MSGQLDAFLKSGNPDGEGILGAGASAPRRAAQDVARGSTGRDTLPAGMAQAAPTAPEPDDDGHW